MYFSYLREDLRKTLAEINPIFSVDQPWKRSHYLIMADIFNEHLQQALSVDRRNEIGGTISHATLKRFFDNTSKNTSLDLRFLKTVDKLSIFLGFENFTHYSHLKSAGGRIAAERVASDVKEEEILDFVRKSQAALFQAYQSLPNPDLKMLNHYFAEECPVRARLTEKMSSLASLNLKLVQAGKRSNFEILDIKLLSREDTRRIVETTEFWNLLFECLHTGEQYIYNHKNSQTYVLLLIDGKWYIWDNYNPNEENIKRRIKLGQ